VKEKIPGEYSDDVLRIADELDHAMIRARMRGQPFVLIEVGAHVVGTIIRPRMWDSSFFRPERSNEK